MGRPATLKVDIVADAKGVSKGVDDALGKFGKLGKAAGPVGIAVGAGLAVGVGALVKFGSAAVDAASRAEQANGAIQSVFGQSTKAVEKFASDSAMRLGLAQTEYKNLAAVVGSQLKNMGKSQQEAAVESDRLITTGADLAATFGGSVSDAVSAVGSLLRGERDPIERYGIAIKDADVQARLAAQGQDKLTGSARTAAEANATLALLTEQAGGALGAFGRESNTLAGTQERLKAKFEDIKAEIGARLLPIVTRLGQWFLREGVPALERFGRYIVDNKEEIKRFGLSVTAVVLTISEGLLRLVAASANNNARLVSNFRQFLTFFFGFADSLLASADAAFGWLPGVGSKIDTARGKLGQLKTDADSKLGAVEGAFRAAGTAAERAADKVAGVRDQVNRLKDKTVTITTVERQVVLRAQRDGTGGGVTASIGGLIVGAPRLYGGGNGLLTAALGDSSSSSLLRQQVNGGTTVYDQRNVTYTVQVDGAFDPPAVAAQLERLLRDQAVRLGRVPSYGTV